MRKATFTAPLGLGFRGAMLATLILAGGIGTAVAQEPDPTQAQNREQHRQHEGEGDQLRQQIRQRIQAGIAGQSELSDSERQTMQANLESCLELNLTDDELEALFPAEGQQQRLSVRAQLRFQNRILAAAAEDLPTAPLTAKIQEGQIKGVPEPVLEQVCERIENQLRTAHRVMTRAREAGIEPSGDPLQERRMTQEMAQHMWRGMSEDDLNHLCEQARLRLRNGICTSDDLISAAETATRFQEEGVDSERAVRFVGEALQHGFRATEMRELRYLVMARQQQGDSLDGFMKDLENCLGQEMGVQEMYRHMWQHGWMGPGDMQGPGGQRHIDDIGGGGPGHQGGSGNEDQHGGQSGGQQQGGRH
jgi:hypothetical protein